MKEPILVVMAAGIGSRYGGLKQTDPVGLHGELIIDYSVHDAIKAGFTKVIFIINRKIENEFKEVIGTRLKEFIDVEYAYQELTDLPREILIPENREKPWGTAHAIYSTRHLINAPFAVINADDYYGIDAFQKMYNFLSSNTLKEYDYSMVGYRLKNTVTEHGYVSRGVCNVDENNMLVDIIERVHIEQKNDEIIYLENEHWYKLEESTIVSMNMWGFTGTILHEIDKLLPTYLKTAVRENPLKCEFFLPYVVDQVIKNNIGTVKVLHTNEKWYGVTYSEDKKKVMDAISSMIDSGKYPSKLWGAGK
ncbi:MAG: nucleotidyltransferase [Clostridiales bacterium]|nr:nucleotidyltransferase [Clostridiales bacterium]